MTDDAKTHAIFDRLPPIFRDCVGKGIYGGGKYCLDYPQLVGDHICASDGQILVRVPSTPYIRAAIPDIAPKLFPAESASTAIGPRETWDTEPTPLPSLDHLKRCDECQGIGHTPERKCSCDYDTPCHDRGIIPAGPCWDCDGSGIGGARLKTVRVRDVYLGAYYVWLLAKYGAELFLRSAAEETGLAVYFTAGEVEGVLMPCVKDTPVAKEAVTS